MDNLNQVGIFDSFINEPLGIIDIGASVEIFNVNEIFEKITFLTLFDIEAKLNPLPVGSSIKMPFLVHEKEGKYRFNETESLVNSSFLKPCAHFVERYKVRGMDIVNQGEYEAITLDNLNEKIPQKYIGELVKIDAQGLSLPILRGGETIIDRQAMCVLCEVEFTEIYDGEILFSDIEKYLRERGFCFYGFTENQNRSIGVLNKFAYSTRERMIHADAVFFKDPIDKINVGRKFSKRNIDAVILCALIFSYYDYALELVKKYAPENYAVAREFIEGLAEREMARVISDWEATNRIAGPAEKLTAIRKFLRTYRNLETQF